MHLPRTHISTPDWETDFSHQKPWFTIRSTAIRNWDNVKNLTVYLPVQKFTVSFKTYNQIVIVIRQRPPKKGFLVSIQMYPNLGLQWVINVVIRMLQGLSKNSLHIGFSTDTDLSIDFDVIEDVCNATRQLRWVLLNSTSHWIRFFADLWKEYFHLPIEKSLLASHSSLRWCISNTSTSNILAGRHSLHEDDVEYILPARRGRNFVTRSRGTLRDATRNSNCCRLHGE